MPACTHVLGQQTALPFCLLVQDVCAGCVKRLPGAILLHLQADVPAERADTVAGECLASDTHAEDAELRPSFLR